MSFAMKNLTAGQLNAIVKNLGGEKAALRFASGQGRVVFDTIRTTEEWWREAGVEYFSPNFRAQFVGREVADSDGVELTHDRLGQDMNGSEVVAHLGGEKEAVIASTDLRRFMDENRESSEWFVAVLEGADGGLWVVSFGWVRDGCGWSVGAIPVAVPSRWYGRCRALSRK